MTEPLVAAEIHRPYRTALTVAGALSCAYGLLILCYVKTCPDIGVHCAFSSVIRQVDPRFLESAESGSTPAPGDELIQVGDQEIKAGKGQLAQVVVFRSLLDLRSRPITARDTTLREDSATQTRFVKIRYRNQGVDRWAWCRLGTIPLESIGPSVLWFVLKLGLFAIGALVFWKRPSDPSSAQFFVLCMVTLCAFMGGYHWVRIATQPLLLLVFMVCAVLLPAVSLHFYFVFPRPKTFLTTHPRRTVGLIYGPPLLFLVGLIVSYFNVRLVLRSGGPEQNFTTAWLVLRTLAEVYIALAAVWYLASVIGLVHSFATAANSTERNQVKWIMFGSVLALMPIGYTLYLIIHTPDDFGVGAATWPMFAASFFLTVAFAVSITRYRLMQLDQIVSSGAVYFLISSLAGLVYYGLVFVGVFATDLLGSHVMSGPSLAQTVWVSASFLVIMLVLDLVRSRVKRALDRRFYRDKYQLDRTLRRMGQAIEQLVDPPTLARRFLQASAELLSVTRGAVYLRDGNPPLYRMAGALGDPPPLLELPPGSPLVETLRERGALLARPGYPDAAIAAQRQLQRLGGEAAHALAHEGQLLAILILGPKDLGTFLPDDLNFLAAFAQLAAVALESAEGHRTIETLNRDLREKVEKISEQQRRILALQSQLMRQGAREQLKALQGEESETAAKDEGGALVGSAGILGSSAPMRQLMDVVRKVSATQSAVLIRGESGTGKELLARALHENSARAAKPYVKVHCAALSAGLLESELFGHVKGAYTGAHRDKVGRFELANAGTLFLDEIGDISLEVQTKLLRVLQEKTFERVGSSESMQVDVRIIAATHQNLEALIQQGRFRQDLYYRLKVIDILVPPLRDRREDIPELASHFLQLYAQRCGRPVTEIDDDALTLLKCYDWPGNIRQLENVMERAIVIAEGPAILPHDLPDEVLRQRTTAVVAPSLAGFGEAFVGASVPLHGLAAEHAERDQRERERLVRALTTAQGNKAEAARLLGLARSTLVSRLKKHGLS